MLNRFKQSGLKVAACISAMMLVAGTANAQNDYTPAGTSVSNTFTLDYSVGSVPQTQVSPTTAAVFTVDRLINVDVAYQANANDSNVAPNATNERLLFRVTNTSNDTIALDLTTFNETGDEFNVTVDAIYYYVDDGDGVFEPGGDDGAAQTYTLGDPTPDLAADRILWVELEGDIGDRADADTADLTLVADALVPTAWAVEALALGGYTAGNAIVADVNGVRELGAAAENLLNDGAGTAREVANAGDDSDTGTFTVAAPDITATKTVAIIATDAASITCSNFSVTADANAYAAPGACVEYVLTVNNAGSTSASITSLTDTLPSQLEFVDATFSGFTGGTPAEPTSGTDCDAGACVVSQTGGTLAAAGTGTIRIRAIVK